MRDTWTIGRYHFTCEVEYWSGDGNKAHAYWNYGTDKKFGGPAKPGYFIEIKMNPQDYWVSKKIHGWIRLVRPFKGPFGPGDIDQFWKTGMTGQEEEILFEVRDCLQDELSGIRYSKEHHRTSQHDRVPTNVYSAGEIESIRAKNKADVERKEIEDIYKAKGFSGKKLEMIVNKKLKQKGKNRQRSSTKKRKERQKIPARKAAPKKAIAIVFVAVIIAAVFVLGNGEISLPNISLPNISLPNISLPDIIGSCKVIDSVIINPGQNQESVIDLILCKEKCEEMIVVSGDLHKNTRVMMELRNPDGNYFRPMTFLDKIDWKIQKETYKNDSGEWKIKITVNGKYHGNVLVFPVGKT